MSKIKNVIAALAILIVSTSAFAFPTPESNSELRAELTKYISNIDFDSINDDDGVIHVHFTVNSKNEIIVLSTDNDQADNKIKTELNYREVKASNVETNKVYTLPVRLDATKA